MEIYSYLRKKKIQNLLEELNLLDATGAVIDSPSVSYNGLGPLFVSSDYKDDYPDAIVYGNGVSALGNNMYSDSYDPSAVFTYYDADTADLAYRLAKAYGIPLNKLSEISISEDSYYIVHNAKEIKNVISHRKSNLRTVVIFSSDFYDDYNALASAFSSADILFLISKRGKEEERLKKALDRIIFSPTIKRLSAVIEIDSIDDALPFLNPLDAVFEIRMEREESHD